MELSLLQQYDIIIFDCDGVILDTNLLKCEAFGEAVKEYSDEIVCSFVNHCKQTFGISRYIKFKEFFCDFANEPFDEDKYQEYLSRYAGICKEIYKNADKTPGCINLLSELSTSNKKLYIASGSDETELNDALYWRGLSKYFSQIYGSPKTKSQCIAEILEKNSNKRVVFIGDAYSDLKASKEHSIDFIYMSRFTVQSSEQDKACESEAKMVINTLEDLLV